MRDTPFICWSYDPVINRQRAEIIIDMMGFICEAVRRDVQYGAQSDDFSAVENFLKAVLFEKMQSPMARPIPKRMLRNAGDTLELVAATILEEREWVGAKASLAAFRCGSIGDELQQRINSFWHPTIDEESPSVATAFEVAFSNLARAMTRIVLLRTISRLLDIENKVPDAWARVSNSLWMVKITFERDVLLFGGLAGGELQKTAVRLVARQTCYNVDTDGAINYGVIHFLQRDGISPGRWWGKTEESLNSDIKAKYEAL